MRVIAGTHKGQIFDAPTGRDTRPTTDRVREAIFSSVTSLYGDLNKARVADLFAGSGAFGIEALSRGACWCTFFEFDKKTAHLVKQNINKLSFADNATVAVTDTMKFPNKVAAHGPYDLLFVDPPYKISSACVIDMLDELRCAHALAPGAIIVYEHAAQEPLSEYDKRFIVHREKKYGTTVVSYLSPKEHN